MTLSRFSRTQTMTFTALQTLLNGKYAMKIANNTTLYQIDATCITMQYHYTDVVRWYNDGTIVLSNGGHMTPTTKERISVGLSKIASIYQKDFTWYIVYNGKTYEFENSMTIDTVNKTVSTREIMSKVA